MLNDNIKATYAKDIQKLMKAKADVFYFDVIDSTNNEAKRHITNGLCNPALFIAREQTNGRGRQGKNFYSPADTGIYMSIVACPHTSFSNAIFLTSAVAVAVCRVIERLTKITVEIKWVNDIYHNGKKIAGILTEAINDYSNSVLKMAIIGVGINISTKDFPSDIATFAGSLDVSVSKEIFCAEIADEIYKTIESLSDTSIMEEYRKRSITIGKDIVYISKGKSEYGHVVGVDDFGGLILNTNEGQIVLRSGEITIRECKNII